MECRSFRENGSSIRGFDVAYFAVSVDPPETNRRFAESLELDYPILSDPDKTVARAYGVLRMGLYAMRHTFVIGRDGRLLDVDTRVRARTSGTDLVALLDKLGVAKSTVT